VLDDAPGGLARDGRRTYGQDVRLTFTFAAFVATFAVGGLLGCKTGGDEATRHRHHNEPRAVTRTYVTTEQDGRVMDCTSDGNYSWCLSRSPLP
jgi:hypothetical protein